MGFEDRIIRKIDLEHSTPDHHPVIKEAYRLAQSILERDATNPHDFDDSYDKAKIMSDLTYVESLKEKFETNDTQQTAKVLEAILYEQIELSNWLGENAETFKTSEYDDFVNGVDMIVEFNDDESTSHLALGVDITFGSKAVAKKFERIKKEIEADNLARIKYFESHGFKGALQQLPRVVIGVEKETVNQLAGLWIQHKKTELAKHEVQAIIVAEIISQLDAFKAYAEKIQATSAIRSYNRAIAVLKKYTDPLNKPDTNSALFKDKVFQGILDQLEQFK